MSSELHKKVNQGSNTVIDLLSTKYNFFAKKMHVIYDKMMSFVFTSE